MISATDGQALAHRRASVVGHAHGPDQLVVELVVPEALHPDGAADDIGVFEGHDTRFCSGPAPGSAGRGSTAGHCARRPAYPVPCASPPSRRQRDRTASQNLETAGALVEEAADGGAELVVLPEYFSVAGDPDILRRQAEPLTGPTVSWASGLARADRDLAGGRQLPRTARRDGARRPAPLQHQLPDRSDRSDRGGLPEDPPVRRDRGRCRLPRVGHRGARATSWWCPRSTLGTGTGGRSGLGLSLCYDLRFPEMYRIMTLRGATVMAVPAAFTAATGPAHWELLLRARAVENQVFVIGAGQVGTRSRRACRPATATR